MEFLECQNHRINISYSFFLQCVLYNRLRRKPLSRPLTLMSTWLVWVHLPPDTKLSYQN